MPCGVEHRKNEEGQSDSGQSGAIRAVCSHILSYSKIFTTPNLMHKVNVVGTFTHSFTPLTLLTSLCPAVVAIVFFPLLSFFTSIGTFIAKNSHVHI
jgi:hypothetical protein